MSLSSSCCTDCQISSYLAPDQCQLDSDQWRLARHCGKSTCSFLVFIELELWRYLCEVFLSQTFLVYCHQLLTFSTFFCFALHLLIILILPSCSHVFLYLQSVNVFFRGFEVEQNFVTSQSSLTTSTSVSGLLPSTVYMVTVTGMYNEYGRPSVYRTVGIKTDMENGAGPRKFMHCVQMHTHKCVGVGVCLCECARLCVFMRWCVLMMAVLQRLVLCLFSPYTYSCIIPDAS